MPVEPAWYTDVAGGRYHGYNHAAVSDLTQVRLGSRLRIRGLSRQCRLPPWTGPRRSFRVWSFPTRASATTP